MDMNMNSVVTVPHWWFVTKHTLQCEEGQWLFHSPDPAVTPSIQDIHWLCGQKPLFPLRAESDR